MHPFHTPGRDDENSVRRRICKRDVEFPSDVWAVVSADAKDLTKQLLVRDPGQRISAAEALKHRWFKDPLKPTLHGNSLFGGAAPSNLSQSVFEGLKEFNKSTLLKQIFLRLLARDLTDIQTHDLRKKFMAMDKSGDGVISKDELVAAMKTLGVPVSEAESIADPISYNQFLAALSERKVKFGKSQLRECYRRLDPEGSGSMVGVVKVIRKAGAQSVEAVLAEAGLVSEKFSFDAFCDIVTTGCVKK